jgi:NAD(P)-dependent dehydrogenase (short-subunit alcohol dehydrogenase family)
MDVEGRVVVITGGGSGIGEALAAALAAAGAAHVVVADIDGAQAQRVAAAVGGTAAAIDVRDESAIKALVDSTEDVHGPIGLFASNAGYVTTGGLEDSNERIQAMWEVHVMSHIYAARAVLPQMIANGGGYLLNTASAAGLLTQIGSLSYSVTKHAAVSLAEWLAITHDHQGIRVSVLCPQAVRTNILENSPDAAIAEWDGLDAGIAGRDGVVEPADVARQCLAAIEQERFWVLPHPRVADYAVRKATDIDRWLAGMRRFQNALHSDGPLPGDVIAP